MADLPELFNQMQQTILEKNSYQRTARDLYDGDWQPSGESRKLLPESIAKRINVSLDWAKIAIDTLKSDLKFDGFKRDDLGFTRLLWDYGAYPIIDSAITNSMIGACAFISVIPSPDGTRPIYTAYTGAEATGVYDSVTGRLKYGLVVHNVQDSVVTEWLFFGPGYIVRLNSDAQVLGRVDLATNVVALQPFVYEPDAAARPFGRSRIGHGARSQIAQGILASKLHAAIAIRNANNEDLLTVTGSVDDMDNLESGSGLGKLRIFNMTDTEAKIALERMKDIDPKASESMYTSAGEKFAAQEFIPASFLGITPANGGSSAETHKELSKPYNGLVDDCRGNYGKSIKHLAIIAMMVMTGQYSSSWERIEAEWEQEISPDSLVKYADGLSKIVTMFPEGLSEVKENILRKMGVTIRESLLDKPMTNFTAARQLQEDGSSRLLGDQLTTDGRAGLSIPADIEDGNYAVIQIGEEGYETPLVNQVNLGGDLL